MGKLILAVDDERDIRDFLKNLLEDQGYEVGLASDGLEAMEKVNERAPDLILLDLQMPEETGTGFFRKLQHSKDHRMIPVIVISGLAGRNLAVSKSVPVFDKPIDEAGLLASIEQALQ
jgi:CheY-like chemotaxis protein